MNGLINQSELDLRGNIIANENLQYQLVDSILTWLIEERRRRCDELRQETIHLSEKIDNIRHFIEQGEKTKDEDEIKLDILKKNVEGLTATRDEKREQCNARIEVLKKKEQRRNKLKMDYDIMIGRREKQKENAEKCGELERDIEQCRIKEGEVISQIDKIRRETGEEMLSFYTKLAGGERQMNAGRKAIERLTEKMHDIWGRVRQDDINS